MKVRSTLATFVALGLSGCGYEGQKYGPIEICPTIEEQAQFPAENLTSVEARFENHDPSALHFDSMDQDVHFKSYRYPKEEFFVRSDTTANYSKLRPGFGTFDYEFIRNEDGCWRMQE